MLGLDISDRSIKMVQLRRHHHRLKLVAYCWQAIPAGTIENGAIKNETVMRETLLAAIKQSKLTLATEDPVVASIPETQSFLRVIEIPQMAEDEVTEAVQWEVAQHIPFGLENVYIDWQWVSSLKPVTTGRREVLVGAAQKKVADPLYQFLLKCGLDVAALELETQAIVRALISPELKRHQGLLIVDIGATGTNVIVHDHGAVRFTASLRRGTDSAVALLPAAQRERISGPPKDIPSEVTASVAQLQPALESLVIEIHGIIEFYTRLDSGHKVNEILLTGGGSNIPGLDANFLKHFDNVHIQRGNPWVNILSPGQDTHPPLDVQESVHYTTALGLALRPELYEN